MSEAATADLATPEAAPAAEGAAPAAPAAPAAAPAAEAATLETPEAVQGEEAAASGQGDGEGEAVPKDGASEGEAAEGASEDEAAEGAPAAYADFDMPEGFTLSADFGADLTSLAKELNLPQAKAQALVNLGVKHAQAIQQQLADSATAATAAWAEEVRSDPEIGGVKLPENMAVAKKAMVAFGSPKLTGLLNQTGLSRHPEVLRLLVRVGEAISEDTLVDGGGGSGGGQPAQKDHAKRLYPNQN